MLFEKLSRVPIHALFPYIQRLKISGLVAEFSITRDFLITDRAIRFLSRMNTLVSEGSYKVKNIGPRVTLMTIPLSYYRIYR